MLPSVALQRLLQPPNVVLQLAAPDAQVSRFGEILPPRHILLLQLFDQPVALGLLHIQSQLQL